MEVVKGWGDAAGAIRDAGSCLHDHRKAAVEPCSSVLAANRSRTVDVDPLGVGIILRSLAPVEHAVIADHTNAAKSRAILQ